MNRNHMYILWLDFLPPTQMVTVILSLEQYRKAQCPREARESGKYIPDLQTLIR